MGDGEPVSAIAIDGTFVDILPDEHDFLVRVGDAVIVSHKLLLADVIDKV